MMLARLQLLRKCAYRQQGFNFPMLTLQQRIEEVMAAKNWKVGEVAAAAGVKSAAVSQWLGRAGEKQTKTIGKMEAAQRLEKATGYRAYWLAQGKGPKFVVLNDSSNVEDQSSTSLSEGPERDVNHAKDAVTVAASESKSSHTEGVRQTPPTIPEDMPYSPNNLTSAIKLMGSLLMVLDKDSKKIIGRMLKDLAKNPDNAHEIARKAAVLATVQEKIVKDEELHRKITMPGALETQPAPLGDR